MRRALRSQRRGHALAAVQLRARRAAHASRDGGINRVSVSDLGFLAGMGEKLGHYVYALVDARGGIFYVGKGKGDRVYQHAVQARVVGDERPEELKLNTIKRIHRRGEAVGIEIVRHGLTDKEAFEVEAAVMDILRLTGHCPAPRSR